MSSEVVVSERAGQWLVQLVSAAGTVTTIGRYTAKYRALEHAADVRARQGTPTNELDKA